MLLSPSLISETAGLSQTHHLTETGQKPSWTQTAATMGTLALAGEMFGRLGLKAFKNFGKAGFIGQIIFDETLTTALASKLFGIPTQQLGKEVAHGMGLRLGMVGLSVLLKGVNPVIRHLAQWPLLLGASYLTSNSSISFSDFIKTSLTGLASGQAVGLTLSSLRRPATQTMLANAVKIPALMSTGVMGGADLRRVPKSTSLTASRLDPYIDRRLRQRSLRGDDREIYRHVFSDFLTRRLKARSPCHMIPKAANLYDYWDFREGAVLYRIELIHPAPIEHVIKSLRQVVQKANTLFACKKPHAVGLQTKQNEWRRKLLIYAQPRTMDQIKQDSRVIAAVKDLESQYQDIHLWFKLLKPNIPL